MSRAVVRSLVATSVAAGSVGGLVAATDGGGAVSAPASTLAAAVPQQQVAIGGSTAADLEELTPSIGNFFEQAAAAAVGGLIPVLVGYGLSKIGSSPPPPPPAK
jgi:hypothetical protein